MRKTILFLLVLLSLPILLVLAQTYTSAISRSLSFTSTWSASITPTSYRNLATSFTALWSASVQPFASKSYTLSPLFSWSISTLPFASNSYLFSFIPSWSALSFLGLQTFRGNTMIVDQISGGAVSLDRLFWDGGVWITTTSPSQLLFRTNNSIYVSQGSVIRTSSGYLVSIPAGRTLVAENATIAIQDLVDPRGNSRFGVQIWMNNTQVQPYYVYSFPMHTYLSFKLGNGNLGSVYLNGTKVTTPIYIGNATTYRFVLTVRGTAIIKSVNATFSGSGDYIKLVVQGKIIDLDYGLPISNATAQVYINNGYVGYDVSRNDGYFMVSAFVKKPAGKTATIKVSIMHDDYDPVSVTQTVSVPQATIFSVPTLSTDTLLLIGSGIAVVVAVIGIVVFGRKAMKHVIEEEAEKRNKFVKKKSK